MRVFAAIRPTDEVISAISAYVNKLRFDFPDVRARWVRPENLHITLRFEGELNPAELDRFIDDVSAVAAGFECFRLGIVGTGAFVGYRGSVALWLGVSSQNGVKRPDILTELLNAMSPRSSAGRRRPTPHITIARMRYSRSNNVLLRAHKERSCETNTCKITNVFVYESLLTPSDSVYRQLAKIPFTERRS